MMRRAPLKRVARINPDVLAEDTDPDRLLSYIDIGSVGRGVLAEQPEEMRFSAAPSRARRLVQSGDVIISTVRTYLRAVLSIEESLNGYVASTGFAVVRPGPQIDPGYLRWSLESDDFIESVVSGSVGVSYPATTSTTIANLPISLPPMQKQVRVAEFLNGVTGRIDTLITEYENQIELLRAERQSTITASMVGEWPTRTLRSLAHVDLGRQRSPQHATGPHMVRYLRAANVKDGVLDLSDVKEMNFTPTEQAHFSLVSGDVLVSEGSGSLRSVGANAVWSGELDGTVCFQNTLLRLRPRSESVDADFLAWLCRSYFDGGAFAAVAEGVNIHHLSANRVRALPAPFPPAAEQHRISALLNAETSRIDLHAIEIESQIGSLRELRQALITTAVTEGVEACEAVAV